MCAKATMEEFEALLNESFDIDTPDEGSVVKGKVIAIESGQAIIDVGYKMEGRIDLKEFANPGQAPEIEVGDTVEVFLDRVENQRGEAVISREKARREEAWDRLEKAHATEERVDGAIFGRVKGGFTVDLGGAVAFLPGSQVDVRPVRDAGPLMGMAQPFIVLKMDRRRGNIVVSRRAILEESRAEQRAEIVGKLAEGDAVDGVVKNITDYGAFVELEAGVEGLVHVSEMSWTKKNVHPGKIVSTSQQVEVMVLDVDLSKRRISLGLKQCTNNPWEDLSATYPVGTEIDGEIRNITEFGLFVGLNDDIDGLVHLSDISWENAGEEALEGFTKGDMVKAKVLDIDVNKERISLGIKQLTDDPFAGQADAYRKGEVVTCSVSAVTDNGIDVTIGENMTGFIRRTDLSRDRAEQRADRFAVGEKVDAIVTSVDKKTRKLSLSIKARESAEEKQAMAEFGSSDSGASLGDILGAALAKKETTDEK